MARARECQDTRLEYIMSELSRPCIGVQQIGVVEAKIVDGRSPTSRPLLHARESGSQKDFVQR